MSKTAQEDFFGNIYGTTSLGQRGQIVVPKKLRDKLKTKKGDNFLVMEKHGMVVLIPADMMNNFISKISKQLNNITK